MAKQIVKPEKKTSTSHKGTRLTPERIKFIAACYIATGCNNKTKALVDAGYTYKTARYRGSSLIADKRVQAEINKQMRPVIATGQITAINLQSKYMQMVDEILDGKMYRLYAVAKSCLDSLNKTIGGFQADRLPAENIAAKLLDTRKAEELNKVLNAYYSSKYLACNPEVITVESTCKDTDGKQFTTPLEDVSTDIPCTKTIETESPETDPATPHDPPASSTTSPSLTCDGFSEKVVIGNNGLDISDNGE
jgi:Terminase small subunit